MEEPHRKTNERKSPPSRFYDDSEGFPDELDDLTESEINEIFEETYDFDEDDFQED